jgi:hypothetical protein
VSLVASTVLRFPRWLFGASRPLDVDGLGKKARDVSFRVYRDEVISICRSPMDKPPCRAATFA